MDFEEDDISELDEIDENEIFEDDIVDNDISQEIIKDEPVKPQTISASTKQVLTICQKCNKPIYDENDIKSYSARVGIGRTSSIVHYQVCKDCYDKHKQAIKEKEIKRRTDYEADLKKRLIRTLTWSFLIAAVAAVIGAFVGGVVPSVALGIGAYAFSACVFFGNNFVSDIWVGIATWSIHLPGMIFSFDLDGFILMIVVKIALAILGVIFSALLVILATLVAMVVSIFVYPFALVKNLRKVPNQIE